MISTNSIPKLPGIYLMRDSKGEIIYIGKAKNLFSRIKSYFDLSKDSRIINMMFYNVRSIDYIVCGSNNEAMLLEQRLIKTLKPRYNIYWRDDKSFPLVEVTLSEPFPRLKFVHKPHLSLPTTDISKNKKKLFFGPYPNVKQIKSVIHWLTKYFRIRKCTYDSKIFLSNNNKYQKYFNKFVSCIYYQTKQCTAPCLKKIDKENYNKIIHNVILFLSGKYKNLVTVLQKQLKEYTDSQDYENAIIARDVLKYLTTMFSKFIFREIKESDLITETVGKMVLLKKLKEKLNLRAVPSIIEAIDVSNIQGENATGAVVRFVNGVPDKSEYRRYKIKTIPLNKVSDYDMIKEVVKRRYFRLLTEKKTLPDLVLIDGGKGQLNTAVEVFTLFELKDKLDIISLAKKKEEIFIPQKDGSIKLTSEPEDNILRHIRDEAHRFAIYYHKVLRKKNLL